jgi:hypothetical protein
VIEKQEVLQKLDNNTIKAGIELTWWPRLLGTYKTPGKKGLATVS